jgi:hypothetical protein
VEMLTKSLVFGVWPDADFPPHTFPLVPKLGGRREKGVTAGRAQAPAVEGEGCVNKRRGASRYNC